MSETTFTTKLVEVLRRGIPYGVTFKHADRFTHGVPDISHAAIENTSWWEVKYANPDFDCPGIQELTMKRLAKASFHAAFIIFQADPKETYIVHPNDIEKWERLYTHKFAGHAFIELCQHIQELHRR